MKLFRLLLWWTNPLLWMSIFISIWVWVVYQRWGYPYELEWMEGGMIAHAQRVIHELPIYAPPSTDFVPFFYTPGYAWCLSWLYRVYESDWFWLARGLSIGATITICICIWLTIAGSTTKRDAFLGVGLYLSLYRMSGAFYDLARPDSCALAFVTLSLLCMLKWRGVWSSGIAGLLLYAALFTKQTTVVFIPPLLFSMYLRDRREFVICAFFTIIPSILGGIWLNHVTNGSFWRYIFEGHQGHVFYWKNILLRYWRDVLCLAPILLLIPQLWLSLSGSLRTIVQGTAALLGAAFFQRLFTLDYQPHMYYRELIYEEWKSLVVIVPAALSMMIYRYYCRAKSNDIDSHAMNKKLCLNDLLLPDLSKKGARESSVFFFFWIWLASTAGSALNHSTQWAYSNCFMPMCVGAALFIPIALKDLADRFKDRKYLEYILTIQLIALLYIPTKQVPDHHDPVILHQLISHISSIRGEDARAVFIPAHPQMTLELSGQIHTHQMGINDVAYRGGLPDLSTRLHQKEWGIIVLDEGQRLPYINESYYLAERLLYRTNESLRMKTGYLTRPAQIWRPSGESKQRMMDGLSANFETHTIGWDCDGFDRVRSKRGEGVWSLQSVKRLASAKVCLSIPQQVDAISLLIRVSGLSSNTDRNDIEIKLHQASQVETTWHPKSLTNRWTRIILPLSFQRSMTEHCLSIFDRSETAQIWIDDVRWVYALDKKKELF